MSVTDQWLKDHIAKAKSFVTKLSQLPKPKPAAEEKPKETKTEPVPPKEDKKVEKFEKVEKKPEKKVEK